MKRSTLPLSLAITLSCIALGASAQAQLAERQYLSEVLALTSKKNAAYYRIAAGKSGEAYIGKTFAVDGWLKAEGHYTDAQLTVEHGEFTFYHPNGKVESKGEYTMGNKAGVWKRFDQWGRPLAEKVYDPEPLANIIYTLAQTMPSYPGGEKALVRVIREKLTAPDGTLPKGQITASFVVEKSGALTDVKVIDGQSQAVDQQVVDVIRSTSPWQPGAEKGLPVRVQMRMPVQF